MKRKILFMLATLSLIFITQLNQVSAFEKQTIQTKTLPLNIDGTNGKEQYSIIISDNDVNTRPEVTILSLDKEMADVNVTISIDGEAASSVMFLKSGDSVIASNKITREQVGKKVSIVMSTNSKSQGACKIELSN